MATFELDGEGGNGGKSMSASSPSYNRAVRWIAYNDNDAELDQAAIEEYITIALVADLFGKTTDKVAADVFNVRKAEV